MLSDIISSLNMSVYKFAKEVDLPYSTVNEIVLNKKNIMECNVKTLKHISSYLKISVDELLNILNDSNNIQNTWHDNKEKIFNFPIVCDSKEYDAKRIYPLKQKIVKEIYESLSKRKEIKKVILFGSSLNITCTKDSDLDLAIELFDTTLENKNIISEIIQNITNYNSDIIWLDTLDKESTIYNRIMKGLLLYEQVTSESES